MAASARRQPRELNPGLNSIGPDTIDEEQSWSGNQEGDSLLNNQAQSLDFRSDSTPKRRSTAPTASSTSQERQASGTVNRARTTYEPGSGGANAQQNTDHGQHTFSNLQGFPESSFLEYNLLHPETFNTAGSGPFEDTIPWDQKSLLSLGRVLVLRAVSQNPKSFLTKTDGGGIRGYSTLLIIQELMKAIGVQEQIFGPRKKDEYQGRASSSLYPVRPLINAVRGNQQVDSGVSQNEVDSPTRLWLPCHYFDYMAGTSTGGLISIMLGRLRMSIDDCIKEYENLGGQVFANPRWFHIRGPLFCPRDKYDHKVLKRIIQSIVNDRVPKINKFPGGKTFASDENRCRVVVVAYVEEKSKAHQHAYLFRTYKKLRGERNPGPAHDIPIWQVARATSAAPTYFKEVFIEDFKYIDGGFGTNNPCRELIREVREMNNSNSDCIKCVISVGTGLKSSQHVSTSSKLKNILTVNFAKYFEYIHFSTQLATQSEGTHADVSQLRSDLRDCFDYERFNVDEGLGEMKLDEWKARGHLKVRLGEFIGRKRQSSHRRRSTQNGVSLLEKNGNTNNTPDANNDTNIQALRDESNPTVPNLADLEIPKWLRKRNKTLKNIRRHTEKYLEREDIKEKIQECAMTLVEIRRRRIACDEQRWRRACYGTWYQCRIPDCPRGEIEYHDRRTMYQHIEKKHGDKCAEGSQLSDWINERMAEFEVVME